MKRRDFLKGMSLIPFAGIFGYEKTIEAIVEPVLPVIEFAKKLLLNCPGGLFKFKVDEYHKHLAWSYENNNQCLLLKYRQGGFSTFNLIQGLYDVIHKPKFNVAYISGNNSWSEEYLNMAVGIMCNNIEIFKPHYDYLHVVDGLILEIKFKNGNKMMFSSESFRGRQVDRVFFDEAAWIPNLKKLHESLFLATCKSNHKGMKLCFTSTPNRAKGYFYDIYKKSKKGDLPIKVLKYDYLKSKYWRDRPEDVIALRKNLSKNNFNQEMLCEFLPI